MSTFVRDANRPNLLQVVLSLNAGGTERLVVDMTLALNEHANIAVVCLDERGTWAERLRIKAYKWRSWDESPASTRHSLAAFGALSKTYINLPSIATITRLSSTAAFHPW